MKRLMATIGWVNAVGYSAVTAAAVILHAWGMVVLALLAIFIAHRTLYQTEKADVLHGSPEDAHQ